MYELTGVAFKLRKGGRQLFFLSLDTTVPILKSDALVAEKSESCEDGELEDDMPERDACKNNNIRDE